MIIPKIIKTIANNQKLYDIMTSIPYFFSLVPSYKTADSKIGERNLYDLFELKDKTLGCWCYPEKCHGDVLIELVEKYCYDDEKQMLKDKISKHINNKDK